MKEAVKRKNGHPLQPGLVPQLAVPPREPELTVEVVDGTVILRSSVPTDKFLFQPDGAQQLGSLLISRSGIASALASGVVQVSTQKTVQ